MTWEFFRIFEYLSMACSHRVSILQRFIWTELKHIIPEIKALTKSTPEKRTPGVL